MFTNKILLITGGTGSFGNAVLKRFLNTDIAEIQIFSRDEKKQDDMRKRYNSPNNMQCKFISMLLGICRDWFIFYIFMKLFLQKNIYIQKVGSRSRF